MQGVGSVAKCNAGAILCYTIMFPKPVYTFFVTYLTTYYVSFVYLLHTQNSAYYSFHISTYLVPMYVYSLLMHAWSFIIVSLLGLPIH